MSKRMFDTGFDPYDALIELNARLTEVEKRHNMLVRDYEKTQRELSQALHSLNNLQRGHLALSELVKLKRM